MNSFELAVAAEARRLAQTGTVALRNVAVEAQRRVLARISARKDAAFEVQRRFEAEAAARRDAMKSSPQYGPALNNVRSDRITTENCPDGPVLNLLSFELSEGVDLSDGATAPGKLFKAAMEYVRTIPGSVEIKLARETQNFCILSLWDSPLSWSSFQKSVGFTRIAPLVTHDIANRSMMLPRLQRSFSSKAARFLWRIEIIFQADLDSNARSRFESQVSAVVGGFSTGACREFASGWIEHNVPYTRFPISEEDIPARTECTYLILYESAEDNDAERDISELRQRIGLVTLSPGVEKKFSISPQMTYQDTHEPPSLKSEPPSLDSVPVQSQAGTLAGALQRGIRRSTRNEQMEVVTAQLTEYKCYPTDPYTLSQAQHLYMRSSIYTALWRLGTGPNRDLVLPEPYVVDITWLKTRSSLDMIKRRVAKMLNYRIRQLVGYHSGFWVRVADSAQEFAVFTGIYLNLEEPI
ncbi:hypothetical protein NQ176_g3273 [Zarea fungicola]|uniref:Uncharacterized protein n=1 Tax=Zarea fungicola TaxID=93591 RepID=A0ACC1NKS0_9HYPO|nr:hypothetical protein NQ176_g3273 [Lecanicillium fungicola]